MSKKLWHLLAMGKGQKTTSVVTSFVTSWTTSRTTPYYLSRTTSNITAVPKVYQWTYTVYDTIVYNNTIPDGTYNVTGSATSASFSAAVTVTVAGDSISIAPHDLSRITYLYGNFFNAVYNWLDNFVCNVGGTSVYFSTFATNITYTTTNVTTSYTTSWIGGYNTTYFVTSLTTSRTTSWITIP